MILYTLIFLLCLLSLAVKNIHFEASELGVIVQILHPEYPKGPLAYDPYQNYSYLLASMLKIFGLEENIALFAPFLWLLEMLASLWILGKISNFLFKNDRLALVILLSSFILFNQGEVDQKTFTRPVYLLAVYFFLCGRWNISALLTGLIFYLHVGMGVWWLIPSVIALIYLCFIKKKIRLPQVAQYLIMVAVIICPLIVLFKKRLYGPVADDFVTKFMYYENGISVSLVGGLFTDWLRTSHLLAMVGIILAGRRFAQKEDLPVGNILPVMVGVFGVYLINFILSDILFHPQAISLQLMRVSNILELFFSLFLAYLLARQLRAGNCLFFILVAAFSFGYVFLRKFFGEYNQPWILNIVYFSVLVYELCPKGWRTKIFQRFRGPQEKEGRIGARLVKSGKAFQNPVFLLVFMMALAILRLPLPKTTLKKIFKMPEYTEATKWAMDKSLNTDIVAFVNSGIHDRRALVVIPFEQPDFAFYSIHRSFIHVKTPSYELSRRKSMIFRDILVNDLGYDLEEFFRDLRKGTSARWQEAWQNLSEETILRWQKKYHVTHVVRENDLPLSFPVLYQSEYYTVYEVR